VRELQIRAMAVIVMSGLMLARPQRVARAVPMETGCVKCFQGYCPDPVGWCIAMMPWCSGTPVCVTGSWMCPSGFEPSDPYVMQVVCGDEPE
jgi:hypothetical protein